jgi:hypothetical protein
MKTTRIKTANRPFSLPRAKLRKVVAAAYAIDDSELLLNKTEFVPIIITRDVYKPSKKKKK